MRRACIDIGTNSVKLLVADVEDQRIVNIPRQLAAPTRIGQGVNKTCELLPEAMDRTVAVVQHFKQEAELLGASEIIPVATSAVRDAQNRDVFMQEVTARTGLKPLVISGREEARLTYIGVCSDPQLHSRKLIMLGVGGGSSEFVVGQAGEIEDIFSVNTGCVRLTEEFIHSDPVAPDELQKVIEYVTSLLHSRLAGISMDDRCMVGVGGTISSLLYIHQLKADGTHRYVLQRDELASTLTYLSRMKLEDRKKVPGLAPQRADVIVAGAAIFSAVMNMLDAKEIAVSGRGMRYGVLLGQSYQNEIGKMCYEKLGKKEEK